MRRPLLAGLGVAAVLIVAACSPDQPSREPLAPADAGLAKGGGGGSLLCANNLAKDIDKLEAVLFTTEQIATLDQLFATIKSQCPQSSPSVALMTYIQNVIDFRPGIPASPAGAIAPEITQQRAEDLVKLWELVTTYATSAPPLVRPPAVMLTGQLVAGEAGTRGGGADVLDGTDLEMTTFDRQAGVKINAPQGSTPANPTGMYLITMEASGIGCPITTLRPATNAQGARPCYEVKSYPAVSQWNPKVAVGMCIERGNNPAAITHANPNFGTEVLPAGETFPWGSAYSCTQTHTAMGTWLGREAGPVGRALARAIDYLRPQPLFADDAGESGLGLFFSPFGGALTVVFQHGFETPTQLGPLADGAATDVGHPDGWEVVYSHPGFVQVQNGFGGLSSNVVVINQALGNCAQCPTVSFLGTRLNPSATDTIGVYEITWSALQNKPSVKEAPFVVRAFNESPIFGGAEIARLSYVTEQGAQIFKYNGETVPSLTWAVDVPQDFKITVNLLTVNGVNSYRTSLAVKVGATYQTFVSNARFRNADPVTFIPSTTAGKTVTTIGYFLDGIDAGVIAADNFIIRRLSDQP